MRLIDADAMLEYLDLMYDKQDDWRDPYNTGVLGAINYIEHKAPIIDSDRLRGEWIDIGGYEVCKNCHEVKRFPHWNFCPNCGMQMKGADNETD